MSDGNRNDVQQRLAELNDTYGRHLSEALGSARARARGARRKPLGLALERYPPQHHRGR